MALAACQFSPGLSQPSGRRLHRKPTPGVVSTFFRSSHPNPSLRDSHMRVLFSTAAKGATIDARQFGLMFSLVESLDVLSDHLRLLVANPSDALVVRRLAPRLAFSYVLHDLTYFHCCSFQSGGLDCRFAFTISPVATRTLGLVERRPVTRCP